MSAGARTTPPYLIEMKEAGSPAALIRGVGSADSDLFWHMRKSVADIVSKPIRYMTNYYRRENLQDLLRSADKLIVSPRMREAIEPWLKDYEFLPVELELSNHPAIDRVGGGEIVQGYCWLNSWRRLDIVDPVNSMLAPIAPFTSGDPYEASPVVYRTWRKLVFNAAVPKDEHFFGLTGLKGEARYISPKLHQHLNAQGLRVRYFATPTDAGASTPREVVNMLNPLPGLKRPQA